MTPELERTPMPDVTRFGICKTCGEQIRTDGNGTSKPLCCGEHVEMFEPFSLITELLSLRKSSHSVSQCCPMSERLAKRVEELESQCVDYDADVKRSIARVTELEAIVARLPKTADGVPITPGMKAYHYDTGEWWVRSIRYNPELDGDHMMLSLLTSDPSGQCTAKGWQLFSTREAAAEASAKGVKGGL